METSEAALKLVKPIYMMASVDLRYAYYSVLIQEEVRKFLWFIKKGKVYKYTCLPVGISCAPSILKPVFSVLRQSTAYIDDSLLAGYSQDECISNVTETVSLKKRLGFIINKKKGLKNSRSFYILVISSLPLICLWSNPQKIKYA